MAETSQPSENVEAVEAAEEVAVAVAAKTKGKAVAVEEVEKKETGEQETAATQPKKRKGKYRKPSVLIPADGTERSEIFV